MKKCVIVAAGVFGGIHPNFTADFVIAADAGYDNLGCYGIEPSLLIGDLDSISVIPEDVEVITFPKEKDESDLELSVEKAIASGFECFYIYGALGKRLDHTLGNISVLVSLSKRGYEGYLIGENEIVTAVTNGRLEVDFAPPKTRDDDNLRPLTISVFAMDKAASGITLSGMKYPLNNDNLEYSSTRGLSNEVVEGETPIVEVKDGTLVVVVS